MDLHKKRILITGGSSGLGKAMAKALVDCGAEVLITGRDEAKVERVAAELGCWGMAADAAKEADIQKVFESIDGAWNGIDVLINNAGIGFFHALDELEWAHFETIFQIFPLKYILHYLLNHF